MFSKSEVNGNNSNEVFRWLRQKSRLHNTASGRSRVIPWNFTKFVVSTSGEKSITYFNPRTPIPEVMASIEQALGQGPPASGG